MDAQAILEQQMVRAAEVIEEQIDEEIKKVDEMDDDDLDMIRQRRIEQLKRARAQKDKWASKGHGVLQEFKTPEEFFKAVKSNERLVVHFYRTMNDNCKVMDQHLSKIAPKHYETLFAKVDAEKVEGLAEHFNVFMLPTLMLIEAGKTNDSIIGFDEFGGSDKFPTKRVVEVLAHYGMVNENGMLSSDAGI